MDESHNSDGFDHGVYWKEVVEGSEIPGSTRVPVFEIKRHFSGLEKELDGNGTTIVDLGSGSGRSTEILKQNFNKSEVVALDLSFTGLKETNSTENKVQATVVELPFADESVDVFSMCGVMTNLVDEDPKKSLELRKKAAEEIKRSLKDNGLCVISDFTRPHLLSDYPVDYGRHALITKEEGTIAVFNPTSGISFRGKTNDEVASLSDSPHLQRFAHHYTQNELASVFSEVGLKPESYSVEIGKTPSGTPIDTIILTVRKVTGK